MLEKGINYEDAPELIGKRIDGIGSGWKKFNGHKIVLAKKPIIFGGDKDRLYEVKLDNGRWCTPYIDEIK